MTDCSNKYKILQTLGQGSSSEVYLAEDKEHNIFVLKYCNMQDQNKWLQECQKEITITSALSKHPQNYDFPISHMENINGENVMISTFIQGRELSKEILDNLPDKQQKQIAEDMAQFLYHLHNQDISFYQANSSSHSLSIFNGKGTLLKEKMDMLPANVQEQVTQIISDFDKDTNYGKTSVICHNDLIKDNILFNQSSQKLSVIDFGDIKKNDIYTDFAYLMRAGQLGDNFGIKVIDAYNLICRKHHSNIYINPHTAKKLAVLLSLKKIKNTDNNHNPERARFISYLQEYQTNKASGLYKTKNLTYYKQKQNSMPH